ncbi:MAG: hypothetical protein ACRD2I_26860 [Vicinamibacterales bacterium]
MKTNGSVYVSLVFAALIGYFGYQWWFNPSRAVKQRLGQVAGALSVPEDEGDIARVARLARLRSYLADDLRLRIGAQDIATRDAAVAVAAGWKPQPGSGDVHFADVQVFIESDTAAHAYLAVELTNVDRESGRAMVDSRDANVSLAKRDGEWVVTAAESKQMPGQP